MRIIVRLVIGLGLLALLLAAMLAARGESVAPMAEGAVTVGAMIFPLADIVQQVGGEHVRVVLVLPPGTSEHAQELTPQRVRDLQSARVLFSIGHGLDDQLAARIVPAVPGVRVVTMDRGIDLRPFAAGALAEEGAGGGHGDAGTDPHYWLAVPNAQKIAATVAETLTEIDPAHAAEYQGNLAAYQAELAALEAELQAQVQPLKQRTFLAMHDAWSYLAAQYGLRLAATYEPVEGREPTLADLQRLQETINQFGITAFFAEPQKASSSATQLIEREFGLRILTLDPLGGGPETDSYIELMRFNVRSLVEGLSR